MKGAKCAIHNWQTQELTLNGRSVPLDTSVHMSSLTAEILVVASRILNHYFTEHHKPVHNDGYPAFMYSLWLYSVSLYTQKNLLFDEHNLITAPFST